VLSEGKAARVAELYLGGALIHSFSDFQQIDQTFFLPLKESAGALGIEGFADGRSRAVFFRAGGKLLIIDSRKKEVYVGSNMWPLTRSPIWTELEVYVPQEVYIVHIAQLMGTEIRVAEGTQTEAPAVLPGQSPGALGLRDPVDVIVIDPGHGGEDPGARGPGGVLEKNVTLEIAKKLRARLLKEPGLAVRLTREGDATLSLTERPQRAQGFEADVFVSIHANGFKRISAEGFETFFASLTATDQAALDLANWENQAGAATEEAPEEVKNDIELILGDMAQTESLADSQRLAELIQGKLALVMESENRGVKQAPFNVLMQSTMPAVLVEVGFITSPREARNISDDATQNAIVEALALAILDYRSQTNARLGLAPKE